GWWLDLGTLEPVSLLDSAGLSGALISTFVGLAVLAAAAAWRGKQTNERTSVFNKTLLIGAVLLAILAVLNLVIAGQPSGAVHGLCVWAAMMAHAALVCDPTTTAVWIVATHDLNLDRTVFLDYITITSLGILGDALFVFASNSV